MLRLQNKFYLSKDKQKCCLFSPHPRMCTHSCGRKGISFPPCSSFAKTHFCSTNDLLDFPKFQNIDVWRSQNEFVWSKKGKVTLPSVSKMLQCIIYCSDRDVESQLQTRIPYTTQSASSSAFHRLKPLCNHCTPPGEISEWIPRFQPKKDKFTIVFCSKSQAASFLTQNRCSNVVSVIEIPGNSSNGSLPSTAKVISSWIEVVVKVAPL